MQTISATSTRSSTISTWQGDSAGKFAGRANAYQFAVRRPERVTAIIIEDIGAEIERQTAFALDWAGL